MKIYKFIILFNFLSLIFCDDECMLTQSAPVNVN